MTRVDSKLFAATLVLVAAISGCAGSDEPGAVTETAAGLVIEESADGATGHFLYDGTEVRFSTRMLTESILDMTIAYDGMTLTYTADFETGVVEHDGFASDNGADTQMLDSDREVMLALSRELDELGADVMVPVAKLRDFANVWAEFPTTMDLQGHPAVEPYYARHTDDRWYEPWNGTSLCDHMNQYVYATHDDWDYNRNDDRTTLNGGGYLSMHGPQCSTGDQTNFFNGNSWSCSEPDHQAGTNYAYGLCFGRCGAGCGSGRTFTISCLDHDECVRTGHDTASLWCDDEFSGTLDDFAFAPNC